MVFERSSATSPKLKLGENEKEPEPELEQYASSSRIAGKGGPFVRANLSYTKS